MSKPSAKKSARNPAETRQRLVGGAVGLMLRQGFAATSVDEICAAAGMTKGSFFHHFSSKEAICQAAVEWWGEMGTSLYAAAWADPEGDPLAQMHAMIDIMISFTQRPGEHCVCMVGMMSQELSQTHPDMRAACAKQLELWSKNVAKLLTIAKQKHRPSQDFDPAAVAWFLNSLWQGSMLIGKTCQTPEMIVSNLRLAHAYVDSLFLKSPKSTKH